MIFQPHPTSALERRKNIGEAPRINKHMLDQQGQPAN